MFSVRDESGGRQRLSRERIVATALALVEAQGLSALTFRRLGDALQCEAMSVYHYFPSKRHLLDALVAHVLDEVGEPPAAGDAIGRLRHLGLQYRSMAHRHPQFFPYVALHRLDMPAGAAFTARMLGHFRAVLPDDRLAAQAFRIFGYYVIGAALDEAAEDAGVRSAAEPDTDKFVAREDPRFAAGAPYVERPPDESPFELGFDMMLKGIAELRAATLAEAPRAPKPVVRPKSTYGFR